MNALQKTSERHLRQMLLGPWFSKQGLSALWLGTALALTGCQNMNPAPRIVAQPQINLSARQLSQRTVKSPVDGAAKASTDANAIQDEEVEQDLWQRVRAGYRLRDADHGNTRVLRQQQWFSSNPKYLDTATLRGSLYLHYVVERLEERDMPTELALLPMIESAYNPTALSTASAEGLWQFMPATGRDFNLHQSTLYNGRRDVTASTGAALDYLAYLHQMFNNDWLLALAAYNCGEGTVAKAIARNRAQGLPTDYWSLPLPQETRNYVPKLLALADIIQTPQRFGISLLPVANRPYFFALNLGDQPLDLTRVAALGNIDPAEFYLLNPAFAHHKTPGGGPQRLLIPAAKARILTNRLAAMTPRELQDMQIPRAIVEQIGRPVRATSPAEEEPNSPAAPGAQTVVAKVAADAPKISVYGHYVASSAPVATRPSAETPSGALVSAQGF